MRFGSVCSGIEAASVAWEPLGWRASFLSEIAPAPRAVLAHHYPDVPLRGDFTEIQPGEHDPIELLVGGTPCQSFSVAGLRGGMADERGNLALEYLRLAQRLRPRWLAWENVPGVLSSGGGRDFGSFLGGLGQLGYGFAYRVLDAQFFGLAQRRARVFVVGHLGDWRRAAAVLLEPGGLRGDPAPRREAGEGIARPLAAGSPGGSGYRNDADTAENLIARALTSHASRSDLESENFALVAGPAPQEAIQRRPGGPPPRIAGTLCNSGRAAGSATQQDAEQGLLIAHTLRAQAQPSHRADSETYVTGTLRGHPRPGSATIGGGAVVPFDTTQITSPQNRTPAVLGAPCHPLAAGAHPPAIAFQASQSGIRLGDAHATLDANNGPRRHNGVMAGAAIRRLTPRECERLQGFPDDYTLVPYRGKPMADGPRYQMLGNSMAVPVMAWIGRRIAEEDARG